MKLKLWEMQGWLYDAMFLLKPHARLVSGVARRLDTAALVLDAGCGSGRLGMDTTARVVGVDFSGTMLRTAAQRESAVVQGSVVDGLPFAADTFDQATCLNVLYALGDEYKKALSELHRVLKPGGQLLLANPVSDKLFPLVQEHFLEANAREIAQTLLNLPRFIAWMVNLAIRGFYDSSEFVFLSEEELEQACRQAGFTVMSNEPCYAGIDRLLTLRKD